MTHGSSLNQLLFQYMTPAEIIANRQRALIASAIEIWRVDHDMSRDDFAKLVGVSSVTVAEWESGEHDFCISELSEISCKTGIPIEILFAGNLGERDSSEQSA